MKKSISVVAIAALFAVGTAFTTRHQTGDWWNVTNPIAGRTPGIYYQTQQQIKDYYCVGLNNVLCAYLISNTSIIVKRP